MVYNLLKYCVQDNWPSVIFAMAGGLALSIGNLSAQYALAFVGLSTTAVLTCSIIVVLGLYTCSLLFYSIYICLSFRWQKLIYQLLLISYLNTWIMSDGILHFGVLLFLLKAQPWTIFSMAKLIEQRFFSLVLLASCLQFVLALLFTRPTQPISKQSWKACPRIPKMSQSMFFTWTIDE